MAVNGVVGARYLLTRIGNSYDKEDCVRAVVVNLIRNCDGGDKTYRTAGCTELWNSINSSGKYKHIISRMTISDARKNGLLIGDLPVIFDENTGKCEHIAYYMGGIGGYECIHSSKTRGCVCGTTLQNGFTHVLRHRDITGVPASEYGDKLNANESVNKGDGNDMNNSDQYRNAIVSTLSGYLNMRSTPEKINDYNVVSKIPNKSNINVINDPENGWVMISYDGKRGYVMEEFISYTDNNTDQDKSTSSSFGVFIPCESEEIAKSLMRLFSSGFVMNNTNSD